MTSLNDLSYRHNKTHIKNKLFRTYYSDGVWGWSAAKNNVARQKLRFEWKHLFSPTICMTFYKKFKSFLLLLIILCFGRTVSPPGICPRAVNHPHHLPPPPTELPTWHGNVCFRCVFITGHCVRPFGLLYILYEVDKIYCIVLGPQL